jgi:hypothetical protein
VACRAWLKRSLRRATMMTANPRPLSSAPLDGTPVRLIVSVGSAIASFWSEERSCSGLGIIVRAGFCLTTTQSNLMTRWDGNH